MTSPAIVVFNAFLDSSDLPKEGLSGLLWKFFWRDALIRRYLDVLFVIQLKCSTQSSVLRTVICVVRFFIIVYYPDAILSCLIAAEYVLPMYTAVNVSFE